MKGPLQSFLKNQSIRNFSGNKKYAGTHWVLGKVPGRGVAWPEHGSAQCAHPNAVQAKLNTYACHRPQCRKHSLAFS